MKTRGRQQCTSAQGSANDVCNQMALCHPTLCAVTRHCDARRHVLCVHRGEQRCAPWSSTWGQHHTVSCSTAPKCCFPPSLPAEVSDTALGGQVLMDGNTFAAIKDSLGELGTVDDQVGCCIQDEWCSNGESWQRACAVGQQACTLQGRRQGAHGAACVQCMSFGHDMCTGPPTLACLSQCQYALHKWNARGPGTGAEVQQAPCFICHLLPHFAHRECTWSSCGRRGCWAGRPACLARWCSKPRRSAKRRCWTCEWVNA